MLLVRNQRCYNSSMSIHYSYIQDANATFSLYTPPLPSGKFNWLPSLWAIPDTFVLTHQSLDSYLFLRFLKMLVVACLVGCCITWPILFPVNATGGAGEQQLNVLTLSNVESPWRFFAHAGCAWLYFGEFSTPLACAINIFAKSI